MRQWGRKPERQERNNSNRAAASFTDRCLTDQRPARDEIFAYVGVRAYQAGRFKEAISMFEDAIDANRKNATAWLYVGMMHRELGRLDESLKCISESIRIQPGSPMAYAERADTYYRKGAMPQAKEDATWAIKLDPDYADAYAILGNCRHAEGRYTEALLALAKYSELTPEDDEGKSKYEEYHRQYRKATRQGRARFMFCAFLPRQLPDGAIMSQFLQILVELAYGPKRDANEA